MAGRRQFLRQIGIGAAGILFAEQVLANPYAPLPQVGGGSAIRARGTVHCGGKGVAGVAVSDGYTVTRTASDGSFELLTDDRSRFVFYSLPSGYAIPSGEKGTAVFYKRLLPDAQGEVTADFELTRAADAGDTHAFMLFADPQTLDTDDLRRFREETIADARAARSTLGSVPVFGVSCGDIMFNNLDLFPEYKAVVGQAGIPFFQVLGNHDVEAKAKTDEASSITFENHFGPRYYSFSVGEIHYVVLDDIFWFGSYIGYLDQAQLTWLQRDLATVPVGGRVVVFCHIPPYHEEHLRMGQKSPGNSVTVTNRDLLYRLLEPFTATIIAGHMHFSEYLRDGRNDIHIVGAACGAWWTADICGDGTPNGYGIYSVTGSTLELTYKSTGKPLTHQMRLYKPEAPGTELLANVWAAAPGWQVKWYADGNPMGKMERRNGKDPLAVALFAGPDKPRKHTWAEADATDHLFYATPPAGTKNVTVEAVTGNGKIVNETIVL